MNGWQLAEHVGDEAPWRMQAVLGRGFWDADHARDICRDYIVERIGDRFGVLDLDETSFLKKGKHSVGVARRYSGTAARIENCQIGVFLDYASPKGHALIDLLACLRAHLLEARRQASSNKANKRSASAAA